jgi:hypothetical protein
MSSFSPILRSVFLGLLALLVVNIGWVVFIIFVDFFCGVRPQTAVPVFPVTFIGGTLLLMLRAFVRARSSAAPARGPSPPNEDSCCESAEAATRPNKAVLRSMLIVNRKRVTSPSGARGRVEI